jgi:hypothetical protein
LCRFGFLYSKITITFGEKHFMTGSGIGEVTPGGQIIRPVDFDGQLIEPAEVVSDYDRSSESTDITTVLAEVLPKISRAGIQPEGEDRPSLLDYDYYWKSLKPSTVSFVIEDNYDQHPDDEGVAPVLILDTELISRDGVSAYSLSFKFVDEPSKEHTFQAVSPADPDEDIKEPIEDISGVEEPLGVVVTQTTGGYTSMVQVANQAATAGEDLKDEVVSKMIGPVDCEITVALPSKRKLKEVTSVEGLLDLVEVWDVISGGEKVLDPRSRRDILGKLKAIVSQGLKLQPEDDLLFRDHRFDPDYLSRRGHRKPIDPKTKARIDNALAHVATDSSPGGWNPARRAEEIDPVAQARERELKNIVTLEKIGGYARTLLGSELIKDGKAKIALWPTLKDDNAESKRKYRCRLFNEIGVETPIVNEDAEGNEQTAAGTRIDIYGVDGTEYKVVLTEKSEGSGDDKTMTFEVELLIDGEVVDTRSDKGAETLEFIEDAMLASVTNKSDYERPNKVMKETAWPSIRCFVSYQEHSGSGRGLFNRGGTYTYVVSDAEMCGPEVPGLEAYPQGIYVDSKVMGMPPRQLTERVTEGELVRRMGHEGAKAAIVGLYEDGFKPKPRLLSS